jgi:MFS transporter, PCFT/HCP family, solute carrier family 46 (folate transporter), member 1
MSGIELDSYPHDAEDAPFLDADDPPPNQSRTARSFTSPRSWQVKSPSSIVLMAAIAKFVIVASGLMMMMPLYRLIEDAICHVHYEDDSVDLIEEMKCKVDDVQKPLAYLLGWLGLIGAITSEFLLPLNLPLNHGLHSSRLHCCLSIRDSFGYFWA